MLEQAQLADKPTQLQLVHFLLGMHEFWLGELPSARAHLEQSMAIYDDRRRGNLGSDSETGCAAVCLTYEAWLLWSAAFRTRFYIEWEGPCRSPKSWAL